MPATPTGAQIEVYLKVLHEWKPSLWGKERHEQLSAAKANQRRIRMIVSTTTAIDGRPVSEYVGVVTGEAVLGANVFRDLFAGLRDIVGGRSAGYERSLRQARETAIGEMVAEAEQMGADAVVGVDVDYESIQVGQGGSMLMVSASGTAVRL
jgi:uncharacterized protein YbjQ (UPF0145 family)